MFPGALLDDFGYQIHGAKHSPPSPDALVALRAENPELEIRHDIFMKNIDFSMFQGSIV